MSEAQRNGAPAGRHASTLAQMATSIERQARFYDAPADFRAGVQAACAAATDVIDDLAAGAIDERVGVVIHELGTPLAVVTGALDTLIDHEQALTVEQRRSLMVTGRRHATHLIYLIDHLLGTDEEKGGFPVRLEVMELAELVHEIVNDLTTLTHERRVDVDASMTEHPVSADPRAVQRILSSLVSNAVKYSPNDTPIEILVDTAGPTTSLSVSDHGRGIPVGERESVFRKGYRLGDGSLPGSGLGLFLARGLARAQGGELEADDRHDGEQGATLRLRLRSVHA